MRRIRLLIPVALLLSWLWMVALPGTRVEARPVSQEKIIVYMFWGDGCPHCAEAEPFLEEIAKNNPAVDLRLYEVWYDDANRDLLFQMAEKYGFEASGVPTIFIGDKHWVGFNDLIAGEIEAAIGQCEQAGCADAGAGVITPAAEEEPITSADPQTGETSNLIKVPLLGTIDLGKQSITLSTVLIAFVDGFNPCSLWVLSMLLALVIHTGSRKKILLIGLIFLTVTALIYALFIAGLFSVLSFMSYLTWVQAVVAVIALVFALINIKDYFWYKEGVSLTIADEKKPGLYKKMRNVVEKSQSFWGLIGATVALAAGVSLVEFSCTAGFPVLWTNLLTAANVPVGEFILLLLLYMVIYQIDELIIFLTVVFTLRASRLEEKQGRILKLVGGILMLTLAAVMIIKPALLNNLGSSLLIFGVAFAAAGLILLVHRTILPRFGVQLGTENMNSSRSSKRRRK